MAYLFSQPQQLWLSSKLQNIANMSNSTLRTVFLIDIPPLTLPWATICLHSLISFSTQGWGEVCICQFRVSNWNNSTGCHTCSRALICIWCTYSDLHDTKEGEAFDSVQSVLGAGVSWRTVLVWRPYGHRVYFPPTACTSCWPEVCTIHLS